MGKQTAGLSSGAKVLTRDGVSNSSSGGGSEEGSGEFVCDDVYVDSRDGQQYPTVQIGTQCWMAYNMNYDNGCTSNTFVESIDVGWCGCYNDDANNCDVYGKLYQWSAAMAGSTTEGAQGICPEGWHIPTASEFVVLSTYLGGDSVSGGKLKQEGVTNWLSPNTGATNESGFNGLPSGWRNYGGNWAALTYATGFWSSSFFGSSSLYLFLIYDSNSANSQNYYNSPASSMAIRCLKD